MAVAPPSSISCQCCLEPQLWFPESSFSLPWASSTFMVKGTSGLTFSINSLRVWILLAGNPGPHRQRPSKYSLVWIAPSPVWAFSGVCQVPSTLQGCYPWGCSLVSSANCPAGWGPELNHVPPQILLALPLGCWGRWGRHTPAPAILLWFYNSASGL